MFGKSVIKDSKLIEMILLGNQDMNKAIEHILKEHAEFVMDYLMKQSCQKEEAEDVLYEGLSVFVLNVRSGKFENKSSISTYLIAICKRIWYKRFNKKMLHKKWSQEEQQEPELEYEVPIVTEELSHGLDLLMNNLKEKCKEVLKLWSLSYTMKEIADKLGYSNTQVVMNKKNLCLKELRKHLADNPKLMELI